MGEERKVEILKMLGEEFKEYENNDIQEQIGKMFAKVR